MPFSWDDVADFNPTVPRTTGGGGSSFSWDDVADFNPFRPPTDKQYSDYAMAQSGLPPAAPAGKKPLKAEGDWFTPGLEIVAQPTTPSQTKGAIIAPRKKDTNLERLQKLTPFSPMSVEGNLDRSKGISGIPEALTKSAKDTASAWGDVLFGNIDTGDTILGKTADAMFTPAGQPGRFSENRGEAQEGGLGSGIADWLAGEDDPNKIVGQKGSYGRRPLFSLQSTTPEQGVVSGVAKFGEGLVADPEMALVLAGTQGLGGLASLGKAAGFVPRAVSGYFAAEMAKGGYDHTRAALDAIEAGDWAAAKENATMALLSGTFGALAAKHAVKGGPYEAKQREEAKRAKALDEKYKDIQPEIPEPMLPDNVDALVRMLEIETQPAKRAALQEALRAKGFDPEGVAPGEAPMLMDPRVQEQAARAGMPKAEDYLSEEGQRRQAALDELARQWSDGQKTYPELPRDERALIENWVDQGYGQAANGVLPWKVSPDPGKRPGWGDVVDVVDNPETAWVPQRTFTPDDLFRQAASGEWQDGAPVEVLVPAQKLFRAGALWGPEDVATLQSKIAEIPQGPNYEGQVNQVAERFALGKLAELQKQQEAVAPSEVRYHQKEVVEDLGMAGRKLTPEERQLVAQLGQERLAEAYGLDTDTLSLEESLFLRDEARKLGYGAAVKALPTGKVRAPAKPVDTVPGTPGASGKPGAPPQSPAGTPAAPEAPPLHWNLRPRDPAAPPEIGHASTAYSTQTKTPVDFDWVLDDARNVKDSWDSDFPQQYQNRNTEPKQSLVTIQSIKGKPTPEILADNPFISDGAPMTIIQDGKEIALFGNHRLRAIKELYKESPEKAAQLREAIKRMASSFGFDPARVDTMEQPILRRRMKGQYTEEQLKTLVDEANQRTTAQIDPVQQAKNDAGRLTSDILALFRPEVGGTDPLSAAANREFSERFLDQIVAGTERPSFIGKNGLTDAGKQRIEAALHYRAYADTMSLEWKADSAPEGTRNMAKALDRSAPRWADMRARMEAGERWPELDIAPDISEAASTLALLREDGMPLEEYLAQGGLPGIGNPELKNTLIRTMDQYRNSPARMSEIMNDYADWVDSQGAPVREGLFGPMEPPVAADGWRIAVDRMEQRIAAEAAAEMARKAGKANGQPKDEATGKPTGPGPDIRGEVGDRGSIQTPPGPTEAQGGTISAMEGQAGSGPRSAAKAGSGALRYFPEDAVPPGGPFDFAGATQQKGSPTGRRLDWNRRGNAYFLNDLASHAVYLIAQNRKPWSRDLFEAKVPAGLAVEPWQIPEIAKGLRDTAAKAEAAGIHPEAAAEMRALAAEFDGSTANVPGLALIFENRTSPRMLRHEVAHLEQFGYEKSVGKFLPSKWVGSDLGKRATEALLKQYPNYAKHPFFGERELAMEILSYVSDGRASELGLSRSEAAGLVVEMVKETQGRDKATPIGVIDALQNGIRREVYEQLGREAKPGASDAPVADGRQLAADVRSGEQPRPTGGDGGVSGVAGDPDIRRALAEPDSPRTEELGTTDVIAPPGAPTPRAFDRAVARADQALREIIDGKVLNANPVHVGYHLLVKGLGRARDVFVKSPDLTRERWTTKAKEQMVADFQMLVELAKIAKSPLGVAENPAALAQLSKGREARIMERMTQLGKIVRPLYTNKIYDLAQEHMKLKRYEELASRGGPSEQVDLFGNQPRGAVTKFEGGITADQIPGLLQQVEAKLGDNLALVKEVESRLYAFSDELMQLSRDAGILSEKQYRDMADSNQAYVPLQRIAFIEEAIAKGQLHGGSNVFSVSKQNIYHAITEGSEKTVADPVQSIARNITRTINLVERNKVARAVAQLADRPEYKGVVKRLADAGKPEKGVEMQPDHGYEIFHAMIDGKVERFQAPEAVVESMKRLRASEAPYLVKMIAASTGWLRAGATTFYLPFVLSNAVMDVFRATTQSKYGFNPITDYIPGLTEAVKMQFGKSKLADRMAEAGGMMSGFQESMRHMPEKISEIAYPEGRPMAKRIRSATYNSTLGLVEKLSEISEMSTRLGVARKALKRGATDVEAAFDMRNATVDFNKAGTVGRVLNLFIPFLNARIQGTANITRSFKARPVSTLARGVSLITFPAMAAYLWNTTMYPDVYDQLEDYEKDNAIPIIIGGELLNKGTGRKEATQVINIPMGEIGALFWKPAEEALQAMRSRDHRGFLETASYILSQFAPISFEREGKFDSNRLFNSFLPPPLKAWNEGEANQNSYTGRQLVPPDMLDADPYNQYRTTTAPLAVGIGSATNISPIKIENAAGTMFGGVGRAIMNASKEKVDSADDVMRFLGNIAEGGTKRFWGADLKQAGKDRVESFEKATTQAVNDRVVDKRASQTLAEAIFEARDNPAEKTAILRDALKSGTLNERSYKYMEDILVEKTARALNDKFESAGPDLRSRNAILAQEFKNGNITPVNYSKVMSAFRDVSAGRGWLDEQLTQAPVDARAYYMLERFNKLGKEGFTKELQESAQPGVAGVPASLPPWMSTKTMERFVQFLLEQRKREQEQKAFQAPNQPPAENPARPPA